jgi:hypothetical protein
MVALVKRVSHCDSLTKILMDNTPSALGAGSRYPADEKVGGRHVTG